MSSKSVKPTRQSTLQLERHRLGVGGADGDAGWGYEELEKTLTQADQGFFSHFSLVFAHFLAFRCSFFTLVFVHAGRTTTKLALKVSVSFVFASRLNSMASNEDYIFGAEYQCRSEVIEIGKRRHSCNRHRNCDSPFRREVWIECINVGITLFPARTDFTVEHF